MNNVLLSKDNYTENSTDEKHVSTVNKSNNLNENIELLDSVGKKDVQHMNVPKLTEIVNKNLVTKISDNDDSHGNSLSILYDKNNYVNNTDGDTNKENLQCCKLCNVNFKSLSLLNEHYKNVHKLEVGDEKKEIVDNNNCTDLIESLENKVETNEAKEKDTKTKKYSCDICNREFRNKSSVFYHKDSKHNTNRRFVCSKCNRTFKHKQLLQRHQLVHSSDRPFVCTTCGTTFKVKNINHNCFLGFLILITLFIFRQRLIY